MRQLIHTFVYGCFFIALCATAFCMETARVLSIPLNGFPFYLLIFCATLVQYNMHYFIKKTANFHSERFLWSQSHKKLHIVFIWTGAAGALVSLFFLQLPHFLGMGVIALVTLVYSLPLLPFRKRRRIKDYGLLKILVLSLVWTLITVWLPYITSGRPFTAAFWMVFARRFIFMFILCLAFDIRDVETDRREAIHTLPVMLGERYCYRLIHILLVVFLALSVVYFRMAGDFLQFNAMLISALATYFVIEYSRRNNSDMVYLAGIDGMMLLQALLVAAGSF